MVSGRATASLNRRGNAGVTHSFDHEHGHMDWQKPRYDRCSKVEAAIGCYKRLIGAHCIRVKMHVACEVNIAVKALNECWNADVQSACVSPDTHRTGQSSLTNIHATKPRDGLGRRQRIGGDRRRRCRPQCGEHFLLMRRIVVAAAEQRYGAILIAVGEPIGVGEIRHGVSKVDFWVQKAFRIALIAISRAVAYLICIRPKQWRWTTPG